MTTPRDAHGPEHVERVSLYALRALPADEARAVEAQLAACEACRRDLETVRATIDGLVAWPTDVLRPSTSLWTRLAERVAGDAGTAPLPEPGAHHEVAAWTSAEWDEVAPGISCKVLASDADTGRVSLLVRLAPQTAYPSHRHADIEELHLLEGELWIEDRKLYPGDYNFGQPGATDHRVFSETGCTCVLITSTRDVIL